MIRPIGHIEEQIQKEENRLRHLQEIKEKHVLRGILLAQKKNMDNSIETIKRLERLAVERPRNSFEKLLRQNDQVRRDLISSERARLFRIRKHISEMESRLNKKVGIRRQGSQGYRLQLFENNPSILDETIQSVRDIIRTHKLMKKRLLQGHFKK